MSPRLITRARASALLFGGAALCATTSSGMAQSNAMIRIATLPFENSAEVYYAQDMGFFAKAGIDADIQPMQSAPAIAAAVVSGAIDIGYSAVDTLATVHSKNIPLVVIAPAADYSSPATERTTALIVAANSAVYQAKDLNGRTVAVAALHALGETVPRAWIDQNGGDSSTVKFVEIPIPAVPAALDTGRIDAAWIPEPFAGSATKNSRILAVWYGLPSPKHFLISAWFATPQWARDRPGLVKRFAAVMHETAVWANKEPRPRAARFSQSTQRSTTQSSQPWHAVITASSLRQL